MCRGNPDRQAIGAAKVNKYNKKRIAIYTIVILLAVPLSILVWMGTVDNLFFSYPQVYAANIGNPNNPEEQFFIEVKLRSTTFAANTPMPAEVIIFLNGNYRNWQNWENNTSEIYQVLFLDALCSGGEVGHLPQRCVLTLPRSGDPQIYYNTTVLTYSHGGEFDVLLNGLGNNTQQRVGYGFISIAPTEALHEYRTFKMSFIIGIIAASFGALSLYEQARKDKRQ